MNTQTTAACLRVGDAIPTPTSNRPMKVSTIKRGKTPGTLAIRFLNGHLTTLHASDAVSPYRQMRAKRSAAK